MTNRKSQIELLSSVSGLTPAMLQKLSAEQLNDLEAVDTSWTSDWQSMGYGSQDEATSAAIVAQYEEITR